MAVTAAFLHNFGGDNVRFLARSFGVPGDHDGQSTHGHRWPYGAVAIVAPFNFPLEIPALQLMGALFMGNKVRRRTGSRAAAAGGGARRVQLNMRDIGRTKKHRSQTHCFASKRGHGACPPWRGNQWQLNMNGCNPNATASKSTQKRWSGAVAAGQSRRDRRAASRSLKVVTYKLRRTPNAIALKAPPQNVSGAGVAHADVATGCPSHSIASIVWIAVLIALVERPCDGTRSHLCNPNAIASIQSTNNRCNQMRTNPIAFSSIDRI